MTVPGVANGGLNELFRRGHYMAERHGSSVADAAEGRFEFAYHVEDVQAIFVKMHPDDSDKVTAVLEFWVGAIPVAKAHQVDGQWVNQPTWTNSHHTPRVLRLFQAAMVLDDLANT
jgi:hypothetical protein